MKRHNSPRHHDFDDMEWSDNDIEVERFIATMEHDDHHRRRRACSGRSWQEKRREERWLRRELLDWDQYDDDTTRS